MFDEFWLDLTIEPSKFMKIILLLGNIGFEILPQSDFPIEK